MISTNPYTTALAVTPSDSTDLPWIPRGILVGTAGSLVAVMSGNGATVTFSNLPVGYHPMQVTRIKATGTTAAGIVQYA
jgi:hypothetical protein